MDPFCVSLTVLLILFSYKWIIQSLSTSILWLMAISFSWVTSMRKSSGVKKSWKKMPDVTRWRKEGWRYKPVTFMLPSLSMLLAHPGDSCSSLSVATQFAALQRGLWVIVTYVKNDQNCYPNALGHADWIGLLLFVHNSFGLHIKYSLCSAALKSVNCYNNNLRIKQKAVLVSVSSG